MFTKSNNQERFIDLDNFFVVSANYVSRRKGSTDGDNFLRLRPYNGCLPHLKYNFYSVQMQAVTAVI